MNLKITRKELHEGLQIVSRAVASHTSLPALRNILIDANASGGLRLAATDLELSVEVQVQTQGVAAGGALTVPGKTLLEIVAALPEGDVSLSTDEADTLILRGGRSESRLHGLTAEDFPALPEVAGTTTFRVPEPLLKEMIRQTAYAASDDDTRPILTGIYLDLKDEALKFAATDTHRLAVRTAPLPNTGEATAIVPVRALTELAKVLGDSAEAMLSVRVDPNQIAFETERVCIVSRLIEGEFPRYERVIPKSASKRLTLQRDNFHAALKRVKIMARDAAAKDRVVFEAVGGLLIITAVGDDGNAREEVECVREGDPISIAFNVSYVLDCLAVMATEEVCLEMTEALSPAVLRPVGEAGYVVVVMPMQVQ